NPNTDEQLVVFENDSTDAWREYRLLCDIFPSLDICYKDFDERGGIEVSLQLTNNAGRGLFSETPVKYGDRLEMSVAMIPNSAFANGQSVSASSDTTSKFLYRIASERPAGLALSDIENRPRRMRLNWNSMSGVSEYRIRVRNANKKVIQRK